MKKNLLLLIAATLMVSLSALFLGPRIINPFGMDETAREIVFSIRLPRVLVSFLMGSALGASGAVLQGLLRNPLADPYILGISSGAALMAAVGIAFGTFFLGPVTIPVLAFIGAVCTGLLVGGMGFKRGRIWPERLLLAGIGLGFLFSAVLTLVMSVSSDEGLRRAVLWIFGDLSMADWGIIPFGAVLIAAGLVIAMTRAKALNALILGDEVAHSLGFSIHRERLLLFTSVALMTASSVSLGGMVGFIGLLMPHIMRSLRGADSRALIPVSAIAGGAFLCLADLIGRSVAPPMEVPAGIITALIGSPYFLYLLRRQNVLSV